MSFCDGVLGTRKTPFAENSFSMRYMNALQHFSPSTEVAGGRCPTASMPFFPQCSCHPDFLVVDQNWAYDGTFCSRWANSIQSNAGLDNAGTEDTHPFL